MPDLLAVWLQTGDYHGLGPRNLYLVHHSKQEQLHISVEKLINIIRKIYMETLKS